MSAVTRLQKITLAEMRSTGVRGVPFYCSDYKCSHSIAISADEWPDRVKEKPALLSVTAALRLPYRARLGFARLEASAAYLGREARMRVIGIAVFAFFSSQLSTRPLICAATATRPTGFGKNASGHTVIRAK